MRPKPSAHQGKPCLRRLGRLSAYLDRELPPAVREEIRSHMARCTDCRVMLRTLKKTVALCREAPQDDPPRAVVRRVLAALRGEMARCRPAAR